jgi:hypothetical protein
MSCHVIRGPVEYRIAVGILAKHFAVCQQNNKYRPWERDGGVNHVCDSILRLNLFVTHIAAREKAAKVVKLFNICSSVSRIVTREVNSFAALVSLNSTA